jgi:hypothetical protein
MMIHFQATEWGEENKYGKDCILRRKTLYSLRDYQTSSAGVAETP